MGLFFVQMFLRKMESDIDALGHVSYFVRHENRKVPLRELIGKTLGLQFTGNVACIACNRKIKKTFNQGYCFPCFQSLAECDQCIVKPELCHFDKGTCRQPEWGLANCMIPHTVYLANTSGLKVGITRNVKTRWVDQGAIQALPLGIVKRRLDAGIVEVVLKDFMADRTDWRAMLKGQTPLLDLAAEAKKVQDKLDAHPLIEVAKLSDVTTLNYPVLNYPQKIISLNAEKTPDISGQLLGIKGQYLIFDNGVINLRKYTGYEVHWQLPSSV